MGQVEGFEAVRNLFTGKVPPRVMRFVKQAGRGINRYGLIGEGERVLLGISGGKDSLSMALALALRKRWLPIDYQLEAMHIDWQEFPLTDTEKGRLLQFFDIINVPLTIQKASIYEGFYKKGFNCYACARHRKKLLFETLKERDMSKIAFGHHMDDLIETTLMNVCFRGNFATMMPLQGFFGGQVTVIRPLCEVKVKEIERICRFLELPVAEPDCPHKSTNLRDKLRPIIQEMIKLDPYLHEHIYASHWNIQKEYLPTHLREYT